MKTLLNLLTISSLLISSSSYINKFLSNDNNVITNMDQIKDSITVSKISNLDFDISKISIALPNGKIWASSRDHSPYSHNGLYSSTDSVNFIKNPLNIKLHDMISTSYGILYIADGGYLKKSTNGITFARVKSFSATTDSIGINSDNVIYVGSRNFLYQSTDGVTFNKIYDFGDASIQKIVIAPNNTMYLIVGRGLINYATKSFDKGYHFAQIPNLKLINDVAVTQDNKVYISSVSIYESTDNGNNFSEVPNSKKVVSSLTIGLNNVLYFESTDAVWRLNFDHTISKIWNFSEMINTITAGLDGTIWVGTEHGLFKLSIS